MSPTSFHVHMRRNGQFFGLFAYVEDVDHTFLKVGGRGGSRAGGTNFLQGGWDGARQDGWDADFSRLVE